MCILSFEYLTQCFHLRIRYPIEYPSNPQMGVKPSTEGFDWKKQTQRVPQNPDKRINRKIFFH